MRKSLVLAGVLIVVAGARAEEAWEPGALIVGVVRDDGGKASPGAQVLMTYTTRGYSIDYGFAAATTDGEGRYVFREPRDDFGGTLVALGPAGSGLAPCVRFVSAWGFREPSNRRRPGSPAPLAMDFALSAHGGTLAVKVLRGGVPAAGVEVQLKPEQQALMPSVFRPWGPAEAAALEPSVRSGADGVARFAGLIPGRYTLTGGIGEACGVAVHADQTTMFTAPPPGRGLATAWLEGARRTTGNGTLEVLREDGAGQPVAGQVTLEMRLPMDPEQKPRTLRTDAAGRLRVESLAAGRYLVSIPEAEAEPLAASATDEQLQARWDVLPQEIEVQPDLTARVSLQAEHAGFVRGTIRFAPGGTALGGYWCNDGIVLRPLALTENGSSGETYLAGPFAVGVVRFMAAADEEWRNERVWEVAVGAGAVARLDLEGPGPEVPWHAPAAPVVELADDPRMRVLRADGKPAFGAAAGVLEPQEGYVRIVGIADTEGAIGWKGTDQIRGPGDRPGWVTQRSVIAWMPGESGPVVVPLKKEGETVVRLGPAISVSGAVILGGKEPGAEHRVQVLAAAKNRGPLAPWYTLEATADVDGKFVLPGLAPGEYDLQASVDDAAVSPTVALHVNEQGASPQRLEVAAPGKAVDIGFRDARGAPEKHAAFTLDVPTGPLTDRLWPPTWTTGESGRVRVPALAAGVHRVAGVGTFVVPGGEGVAEVTLERRGGDQGQ